MAIYLYITDTTSNFRHNIIFISACYVSLLQLYSKKTWHYYNHPRTIIFPEEKHRPDSVLFVKDMRIHHYIWMLIIRVSPLFISAFPGTLYTHIIPDAI